MPARANVDPRSCPPVIDCRVIAPGRTDHVVISHKVACDVKRQDDVPRISVTTNTSNHSDSRLDIAT
ncbi:hypothetical protein ACOMHN_003992 [Nucella lapillus]